MSYNPFGKQIGEIEPSDLQKLIDLKVSEGYFVECKREFPEQIKTARAIASLANTDGGWYFVGVEADKSQGNVVTRIAGFDKVTCPDPVAKVRTAVTAHVSPTPVFVTHELPLSDGNAVIAVWVPSDQDTPFVTSDGRIYRRVGDSSEPIPATDRYTLDRLVDGRKKQRDRRDRFCRDVRTFSQNEKQGWVMVFLMPCPEEIEDRMWMLTTEGIGKLIALSRKPQELRLDGHDQPFATLSVPLNAAHTTARSVMLRQEQPSPTPFNDAAIELFLDGCARFFVPFQAVADGAGLTHGEPTSANCLRVLRESWLNNLEMRRCTHPFDAGSLLLALAWFSSFYSEWHGAFLQGTGMLWALRFSSVWRCWPFWDSDEWGNHVEKSGLPILRTDEYRHPEEGMLILRHDELPTLWCKVCVQGGMALGIPGDLVVDAMASGYIGPKQAR